MEKPLNYTPKHSGQVYLLALATSLFVLLVFSLVATSDKSLSSNIVFLSIYRLCLAGALVGVFFLFSKAKNISYCECGIKNKTSPWVVIIAILGVIALVFLSSPFISWIDYGLSLLGIKVDGSTGFSLDGFWQVLLAVVMMALLPAVTEELIYRGMILNGLRSLGKWPGILLSATAFCLMHTNIPQFPYTFLLGILLGLVMYETKSLWLTMSMHFANNLIVILSMAIFGSSDIKTEATSTPIWLAILMFLGAILVVWLVWFLTKKIHTKKYGEIVCQKQKASFFELSWLLSGFAFAIVLTIIFTLG